MQTHFGSDVLILIVLHEVSRERTSELPTQPASQVETLVKSLLRAACCMLNLAEVAID